MSDTGKRFVGVILACLVVLLVVRLALFYPPATITKARPGFQLKGKVRTFLAAYRKPGNFEHEWALGGFIPLTDERISFVRTNIQLSSRASMTPLEEERLRRSFGQFLRAYSRGDFESFLEFRFPITNGTFTAKYLAYDMAFIGSHGGELAGLNTNTPLGVWRSKWAILGMPMRTNCMVGISLKGSAINVIETTRVPDTVNLVDLMENYPVAYANTVYGWEPRFVFDPSPQDVLNRRGKIKTALAWVVVDVIGEGPKPVYCQFYYADAIETWLPCRIGNCGRGHAFLF